MEKHTFDSKNFLQTLPSLPGVYQMRDSQQRILYVGKAQNLKKRVSNYFQRSQKAPKIHALVRQITDIQIIITETDAEALLLENNLIKKYKPRYNVLFRDDKSYPFIFISAHPDYPRIDFHRGPKKEKGHYYGPFPNAYAVRESLQLLQKLFLLRPCSDSYFQHRRRPCIQYQIHRCTAPCVRNVTPEQYAKQVQLAKYFLEGKNQKLIEALVEHMQVASNSLDFERAAQIRDQIAHLRTIQAQQSVEGELQNIDVLVILRKYAQIIIQILSFRHGRLIGSRSFPVKVAIERPDEAILAEFITQYYFSEPHSEDIPQEILTNSIVEDAHWLSQILSKQSGHKVELHVPHRGIRKSWLDMGLKNAETDLNRQFNAQENLQAQLEELQKVLKLPKKPIWIECFDVSHHRGEAPIASCVVLGPMGLTRQRYRRFNIRDVTPGDDFHALEQALLRRYQSLLKSNEPLPDLVVIDGGKGQLAVANRAWDSLKINDIPLLAIAKGVTRKPGFETFFFNQPEHVVEFENVPGALHLLQQIRDEAHRFAITAHRKQSNRKRRSSVLESLSGIGPKRRQILLNYFGGLEPLKNASLEQITTVPGIDRSIAKRIYDFFHAPYNP